VAFLRKIQPFDEPAWRAALAGNAPISVGIALRELARRPPSSMRLDLAMSCLWLHAANPAAALVLDHVRNTLILRD
jgi:hypothetical protein